MMLHVGKRELNAEKLISNRGGYMRDGCACRER